MIQSCSSCHLPANYGLIGHGFYSCESKSASPSPVDINRLGNMKWHATCMSCMEKWCELKGSGCFECKDFEKGHSFYRKKNQDDVNRVHVKWINFYTDQLINAIERNDGEKISGLLCTLDKIGGCVTSKIMKVAEDSSCSFEIVEDLVDRGGYVSWNILKEFLETKECPRSVSKKLLNAFLDQHLESKTFIEPSETSSIFDLYFFDLSKDRDLFDKFCQTAKFSEKMISKAFDSKVQTSETLVTFLKYWEKNSSYNCFFLYDLIRDKGKITPGFLRAAVNCNLDSKVLNFLINSLWRLYENLEGDKKENFFWSIFKSGHGSLSVLRLIAGFLWGNNVPFKIVNEIFSTGVEFEIKKFFLECALKSPTFRASNALIKYAIFSGFELDAIKKLINRAEGSLNEEVVRAYLIVSTSVDGLKYLQQKGGVITIQAIYAGISSNPEKEKLIRYSVLEGFKSTKNRNEFQNDISRIFTFHQFSLETFQIFMENVFKDADKQVLKALFYSLMTQGLNREVEFFVTYLTRNGRGKEVCSILEDFSDYWGNLWRAIDTFQKEGGTIPTSLAKKCFKEVYFTKENEAFQMALLDSFAQEKKAIPVFLLALAIQRKSPKTVIERILMSLLLSQEEISEDLLQLAITRCEYLDLTKNLIQKFLERGGILTPRLWISIAFLSLEMFKELVDLHKGSIQDFMKNKILRDLLYANINALHYLLEKGAVITADNVLMILEEYFESSIKDFCIFKWTEDQKEISFDVLKASLRSQNSFSLIQGLFSKTVLNEEKNNELLKVAIHSHCKNEVVGLFTQNGTILTLDLLLESLRKNLSWELQEFLVAEFEKAHGSIPEKSFQMIFGLSPNLKKYA